VHVDIKDDISFGLTSDVFVNPPLGSGERSTSFRVTLDSEASPDPY